MLFIYEFTKKINKQTNNFLTLRNNLSGNLVNTLDLQQHRSASFSIEETLWKTKQIVRQEKATVAKAETIKIKISLKICNFSLFQIDYLLGLCWDYETTTITNEITFFISIIFLSYFIYFYLFSSFFRTVVGHYNVLLKINIADPLVLNFLAKWFVQV